MPERSGEKISPASGIGGKLAWRWIRVKVHRSSESLCCGAGKDVHTG